MSPSRSSLTAPIMPNFKPFVEPNRDDNGRLNCIGQVESFTDWTRHVASLRRGALSIRNSRRPGSGRTVATEEKGGHPERREGSRNRSLERPMYVART